MAVVEPNNPRNRPAGYNPNAGRDKVEKLPTDADTDSTPQKRKFTASPKAKHELAQGYRDRAIK